MEDSKTQNLISINSKSQLTLEDGHIIIFQNGLQILIKDSHKSHLVYVLSILGLLYCFPNK